MDTNEIRLRLIEAAAKTAAVASQSPDFTTARVLEMAREWERYIITAAGQSSGGDKAARERATLGLPK